MADHDIFSIERIGTTMLVEPLRNISSLAESDVKPELDSMLAALKDAELANIVVDFAAVSYFGSSMLEALRRLWNQIHDRTGGMALCNVSDIGREVLHVTRFDTLWTIYESRDEALASFQK